MMVIDVESGDTKGSVPIEDIAFLILDHPQITTTHHLISALQSARCAIISCDKQHIPQAIFLPFAGHTQHTERLRQQIAVSEPLRKNLWKQTVESKIANQARILESQGEDSEFLWDCVRDVRSGDTTNREGVAAKVYWSLLFGDFIREREGEGPNNLLNFGYAILRSLIARALSSSGFHLSLGIHHKNKYNAVCLADDIMEPYRPYVDRLVLEIVEENGDPELPITKSVKAKLLGLMTVDVCIAGKTRPLQIAATMTTASLYKCITGQQRTLLYPVL